MWDSRLGLHRLYRVISAARACEDILGGDALREIELLSWKQFLGASKDSGVGYTRLGETDSCRS